MEAEWYEDSAMTYSANIADGTATDSAAHVGDIFNAMRETKGQNIITGEARAVQVAAPGPASSAPSNGEERLAEAEQRPAPEEEDEDEDMEDEDVLMGFLGFGTEDDRSSGAGAGSSAAASTASGGAEGRRGASGGGAGGRRAAGQAAAARASGGAREAAMSSEPPPLSKLSGGGGAGARKRKVAGGEPELPPEKVVGFARQQMKRMEGYNEQFTTGQRATVLAFDKKHFKAVKTVTDALLSKQAQVGQPLRDEISLVIKIAECCVRSIKAYKQWARSGNDQEFVTEHWQIVKFAGEDPSFVLAFPPCYRQCLLEVEWFFGLVKDAIDGNTESMKQRFAKISKESAQGLMTLDELAVWQEDSRERLTDALVELVTKPGEKAAKSIAFQAGMLRVFLSPVPRLGSASTSLCAHLERPMQLLRLAFDVSAYPGNVDAVNDALIEIGRKAGTVLKIFTTASGAKLIGHLQSQVAAQGRKEQSSARLASLLDTHRGEHAGEQTREAIVRADEELEALGYQDPATSQHVEKFLIILRIEIASIGKDAGELADLVVKKEIEPIEMSLKKGPIVDRIKCIKNLKYFTGAQKVTGGMESTVIDALATFSDCPLEPMQDGYAGEDVAVYEDLSTAISTLQDLFKDTSLLYKYWSRLNVPVEPITSITHRGRQALQAHEQKVMGPKMVKILDVMERSDPDYWQAVGKSSVQEGEAVAKFPGIGPEAVADGVALKAKVKGTWGVAALAKEEVATLLAALGHADASLALRIQWGLFSVRISYCAHAHIVSTWSLDGPPPGDDLTESWHALADAQKLLKELRESDGVEQCMSEASYGMRATLGLPLMQFPQLDLEVTAASSLCDELLRGTTSKMACRLQKLAGTLESKVPAYAPYVVEKFDSDKIKAELIDVDWEPFARDWAAASKFCGVVRGMNHALVGQFDVNYPESVKIALRGLSSSRTFISVVSTVKLILVKLPQASKSSRITMLNSQLTKCAQSNLPANLIDYLSREVRKLKGS
ncbi:unnamed protein product [Prorocentrum cordatum]|uniref:Exocyst complex component Sec6 n=1 Tax=Prorocentrum cordatum TaxID=2364126 RepID=A0ABN9VY86_9DINO|nr:unnamed protein product [Polarella glacialis]